MQHELAVLEGDPAGDPAESNETMDESDEPLEVDMGVQMGCFEEGPAPGPPSRKVGHTHSLAADSIRRYCTVASTIAQAIAAGLQVGGLQDSPEPRLDKQHCLCLKCIQRAVVVA